VSGALLRVARPDGTRAAYGAALAVRRPGTATVVVVVAETEAEARRLAAGVAAALG
jgi:hypothetical protein